MDDSKPCCHTYLHLSLHPRCSNKEYGTYYMPSQPHSYHNLFESLEDRVLFDGVPDATFILPQAEGQEPIPAQVQNVQQADISGPRELILIDAGVENADQLLEEVLQNRPDSMFEVRVINGNEDGVSQISAILADANGQYLSLIHI